MCGRYVSPSTAEIERAWQTGRSSGNPLGRRFNVAPTLPVQVVLASREDGELVLADARWGLVPGWWKEPKPPGHCFNARAEEAAGKPMWRHAYANARCLIPAAGWYEWRDARRADPSTGEIRTLRQPHFIARADRALVGFAGLMSMWRPENGPARLTCAILTRAAADSVAEVHDRMPVVLQEADVRRWLDPRGKHLDDVAAMIAGSQTAFTHYPVSPRLNAAKVDEESLLEPLQDG